MSKPRFANVTASSRRPKMENSVNEMKETTSSGLTGAISAQGDTEKYEQSKSITDFMEQQKQALKREPTRPITLRFEESLWQQVESLRGPLSKNDFFKYLVDFYADQQNTAR
ncbi:MAG: hypothetical protein H6618_08695 [Deltaproteobacteria bacterium]|nr:hypothetical protein [Deltaproteobacteria bacterium]